MPVSTRQISARAQQSQAQPTTTTTCDPGAPQHPRVNLVLLGRCLAIHVGCSLHHILGFIHIPRSTLQVFVQQLHRVSLFRENRVGRILLKHSATSRLKLFDLNRDGLSLTCSHVPANSPLLHTQTSSDQLPPLYPGRSYTQFQVLHRRGSSAYRFLSSSASLCRYTTDSFLLPHSALSSVHR